MTNESSFKIDVGKVPLDTAKEIIRLSELYLDGTVKFSIAADARAVSLAGMTASLTTALLAAALTLGFGPGEITKPRLVFSIGALAMSCCFGVALFNAVKSAQPKEFDVLGNYLDAFRSPRDLYGEFKSVLLDQAEIYQEQINSNKQILAESSAHLNRALRWVAAAPLLGLIVAVVFYAVRFPTG
jgi:hypothetical protein